MALKGWSGWGRLLRVDRALLENQIHFGQVNKEDPPVHGSLSSADTSTGEGAALLEGPKGMFQAFIA